MPPPWRSLGNTESVSPQIEPFASLFDLILQEIAPRFPVLVDGVRDGVIGQERLDCLSLHAGTVIFDQHVYVVIIRRADAHRVLHPLDRVFEQVAISSVFSSSRIGATVRPGTWISPSTAAPRGVRFRVHTSETAIVDLNHGKQFLPSLIGIENCAFAILVHTTLGPVAKLLK